MSSEELTTTDSGLQYVDLDVGDGPEAKAGDTIHAHYVGTLASDGSKFDSSYDRGEPISFTLGQGMVIKGWDEGLQGMKVGGKRKLVIPPDLGYGNRAIGPIPAGSTLIFEVELVGID
ncbi:MAG: FKBP-type peptidyl-prolyl cis-trans isomerase [Armatimonadia bacterium]|nr:FKBP-type peptidyl-prolyl cis-trans isomerase [Armatimonadia bacterium]